MGLDISAASQLKPIEPPEDMERYSDEYYDWEDEQEGPVWNLWIHSAFPEQAEGIEEGPHVQMGEDYGFRAGSYGGYGLWRDWLARAIRQIKGKEGGVEQLWYDAEGGAYDFPFIDLLDFPDNEGVIGPVASKRLYNDFRRYEDIVMDTIDDWYLHQTPIQRDSWREDNDFQPLTAEDFQWFQARYKDWTKAFRLGSDGGAVMFH